MPRYQAVEVAQGGMIKVAKVIGYVNVYIRSAGKHV